MIDNSRRRKPVPFDPLPLCKRYFAVAAARELVEVRDHDGGRRQEIAWAFGALGQCETDFLGVCALPKGEEHWWSILSSDLARRGIERVGFIIQWDDAAMTGSCGWPEAHALASIEALLDRSLSQVGPRIRGTLACELRRLVASVSAGEAERALTRLMGGQLGTKYPALARTWHSALEQLEPLLALSVEARRVILSADEAVWKVHQSMQRSVKRHGAFPSLEAALSFFSQALRRAEKSLDATRQNARSFAEWAAIDGSNLAVRRPRSGSPVDCPL